MNSKNIKHIVMAAMVSCGLAAVTTACTDTWDDHYDGTVAGVNGGTLWSAIKANPELQNFASVIEACGYDRRLGGSQVFTVFAPVDAQFSQAEANALIAQYKAEKQKGVREQENSVVKEFLQNHIALYNYPVSQALKDTSIIMMNGKYQTLGYNEFAGNNLQTRNTLYSNGVLYTINKKASFFPNVFEYISKDPDLDSLRSFLYNGLHYELKFQEDKSVEGGLDERGRTVYLDSVFELKNELFEILNAELNSEDSTYWMLAPTNEEWDSLVRKYEPYFYYEPQVKDLLEKGTRDSLMYTNTRLAIVEGTIFSRTTNTDKMLNDSAMSTSCVLNYANRERFWGADSLHYYQYMKPLAEPDGVLTGTTNLSCSNGQIMKTSKWKIKPAETFMRERIIQIEDVIKERGKVGDVESTTPVFVDVTPDNPYYNQISEHSFVEFSQNKNTANHNVTFNIPNVLSNVPYDIYIVSVPVLAKDTTIVGRERAPVKMRFTLSYHDASGKKVSEKPTGNITTHADSVEWLLVAEGVKFPVCSYGVNEAEPQVTLMVETRASSGEVSKETFTRTMRFDSIILKPREE